MNPHCRIGKVSMKNGLVVHPSAMPNKSLISTLDDYRYMAAKGEICSGGMFFITRSGMIYNNFVKDIPINWGQMLAGCKILETTILK